MDFLLWYDYLTIAFVLLISTLIGIYFGWIQKQAHTVQEYLLGGKQMSSLPVGLSVAVGHVTGGMLILLPAEVYKYGATIVWIIPVVFLNAVITIYIFIPILFQSKVTTVFEYLEKRFDPKTRFLAGLFYIFQETVILSYITATSALVFAAGHQIDPFLLSVICTGVCLFYTAIGGLKTVIWSDIFQLLLILITYFVVLVAGINSVGGLGSMFTAAYNGQRLNIFDFDMDPTKRDSFWIIVFGFGTLNLYHKMMDQAAVQKFLSVSNFRDCIKSVIFAAVCVALLFGLVFVAGLTMYAKYQTCDPLNRNDPVAFNQLVAYFVMSFSQQLPGISGLFVAGILCAGLSSVSSILNALSGVIYTDFICKFTKKQFNVATAKNILNSIVLIEGVITIGISYALQNAKEIFQIAVTMCGLLNGPMLGLMVLGVLFPNANAQGAFYGTLLSFIIMTVISFTSMHYQNQGLLTYPSKPLTTAGCETNTSTNISFINAQEVPYIFKISHYYTPTMGAILTLILGLCISYLFYKNAKPVDRNLLYWRNTQECKYSGVDVALQEVQQNQ